jgi:hypothetical protein
MHHPTVGANFDLDLLRNFRVPVRKKRLAAIGTRALLGKQFGDTRANRQMGVIPSLGSGVLRLLAPFPLRFLRVDLGITKVIGTIASGRGLSASPEEIGLELAFFTFEFFGLPIQPRDPLQGIAMPTSPIASVLAELVVLTV